MEIKMLNRPHYWIQTSTFELQAHSNFLTQNLLSLRRTYKDLPKQVYHYTDLQGLYGIISEKKFRATHISFMNDADEYQHAVSMLRDRSKAALRSTLKPSEKRVIEALDENLSSSKPTNVHAVFVACFSVWPDDLSQWRAYGGGEAGANIGIDVEHLNDTLGALNNKEIVGFLAPTIYNSLEKQRIIDAVIEYIITTYPKDEERQSANVATYPTRWISDFLLLAASLGSLFKNETFSAEAEWRIVIRILDGQKVAFRPKEALLSPYVEVPLSFAVNEFPCPIRSAKIGPGRYNEINAEAAKYFIRDQLQTDIPVDFSKIPYRVVR